MRKTLAKLSPFPFAMLLLTGCTSIGEKAAKLSVVYAAAAVLSLLLLAIYCSIVKKKEPWYMLLFASIAVVNIGYFALAVSQGLGEALLANRVSYLGSVFLPLSMLMIIIDSTHIRYPRWIPSVLLGLAVAVFLVAASPGYLPIYYKAVSFEIVDGVATLVKDYGPLHILYLIYLLGYFGAMIAIIAYATAKNKIDSPAYAVILAIAVFVNLGVWMIEQLVSIDFEFLSISYIISECFLLGLHFLRAEAEKLKNHLAQQPDMPSDKPLPQPIAVNTIADGDLEMAEAFRAGLSALTPKEQKLYECYIAGMTTDVIMEKLAIKENTLKFHSKNLYSKLGVKSRKQLVEVHNRIEKKTYPIQ